MLIRNDGWDFIGIQDYTKQVIIDSLATSESIKGDADVKIIAAIQEKISKFATVVSGKTPRTITLNYDSSITFSVLGLIYITIISTRYDSLFD